jgi:hypothetical protein
MLICMSYDPFCYVIHYVLLKAYYYSWIHSYLCAYLTYQWQVRTCRSSNIHPPSTCNVAFLALRNCCHFTVIQITRLIYIGVMTGS